MSYSHYELPQQPTLLEITANTSDVAVLTGLAHRFERNAQAVHPSEAAAEDNRRFWGELRGVAYNLAGAIAMAGVMSDPGDARVTVGLRPEEIEPLAGYYKPAALS